MGIGDCHKALTTWVIIETHKVNWEKSASSSCSQNCTPMYCGTCKPTQKHTKEIKVKLKIWKVSVLCSVTTLVCASLPQPLDSHWPLLQRQQSFKSQKLGKSRASRTWQGHQSHSYILSSHAFVSKACTGLSQPTL